MRRWVTRLWASHRARVLPPHTPRSPRRPVLTLCVAVIRKESRLFAAIGLSMLGLALLQLPGPFLTMRLIDAVNTKRSTAAGTALACSGLLAVLVATIVARQARGGLPEKVRRR